MNQKLENLLQMALQTPEEVRDRTEELNVGFDKNTRTWELIVKYHGSLDVLADLGITVEYLIAGYAILTVPENLVESMAEVKQIEYVEKPKRYFYGVETGAALGGISSAELPTQGSCLESVTFREPNLTGEGVLVAIIDSGISFWLPEFRNADGTTRIRYLWDQTLSALDEQLRRNAEVLQAQQNAESVLFGPPAGFSMGIEFNEEQINRALESGMSQERYRQLPSIDTSGHGTAVAGIAVGKSDRYRGVAPEAGLLVVKLGLPDTSSFPRTTEIMRAVTYVVNKAVELQMPLVINLSFGNTYGAHDGSSLLERFLDNAAEIGRTAICVGSGNEGSNAGHAEGSLLDGQRTGRTGIIGGGRPGGGTSYRTAVELAVATYERALNVQLWKNYSDQYRITLRSPGGQEIQLTDRVNSGKYTFRLEQTEILAYFGEPLPYSVAQEIYLDFLPAEGNYITGGVWTFLLEAEDTAEAGTGKYYFYLPSGAARNNNTGFYRPTPEVTLTIPSTAGKVITVGAYDSVYDAYADFSGRGYPGGDRTIGVAPSGLTKPDLVAPGVNIVAPDIYGSYMPVTGTSFATPIVAGSVALLMEWGIVRGNDPFLYGEKVKAYLRKGAQPLRGETTYPNERVGAYGIIVSS